MTFHLQPWSLPLHSEVTLAKPSEDAQGEMFFNGHSENVYVLIASYLCAGISPHLHFWHYLPTIFFSSLPDDETSNTSR